MSHRRIDIDALTGFQPHRRILVSVQFDFALEHDQELFAGMPRQRTELRKRARSGMSEHRHHAFADQIGGEIVML